MLKVTQISLDNRDNVTVLASYTNQKFKSKASTPPQSSEYRISDALTKIKILIREFDFF